MKYTIGLIFILINVSICLSLRELNFMKSLYEDIPKPIFANIVYRRIRQLSEKCRYSDRNAATKAFCLSTRKSLILLFDWFSLDDTIEYSHDIIFDYYNGTYSYSRRDDIYENGEIEFYEQIVHILNNVDSLFNGLFDGVLLFNTDSVDFLNSPKTIIDAYIDDINMVHAYEDSIGNTNTCLVNMRIVASLKSLSKEVENFSFGPLTPQEWYVKQAALDQCSKRFNYLMTIFRRNFRNSPAYSQKSILY